MFASAYKKIFSLILCFSSSSAMVGNSPGNKELEKALSHKADFTYINALDDMSDIYVQKRLFTTNSSNLFDDKHLATANVATHSASNQHVYDLPVATNIINFVSLNSDKKENKIKTYTSLNGSEQLWIDAGKTESNSHLSQFKKTSIFHLGLFSNGKYHIEIS